MGMKSEKEREHRLLSSGTPLIPLSVASCSDSAAVGADWTLSTCVINVFGSREALMGYLSHQSKENCHGTMEHNLWLLKRMGYAHLESHTCGMEELHCVPSCTLSWRLWECHQKQRLNKHGETQYLI